VAVLQLCVDVVDVIMIDYLMIVSCYPVTTMDAVSNHQKKKKRFDTCVFVKIYPNFLFNQKDVIGIKSRQNLLLDVKIHSGSSIKY